MKESPLDLSREFAPRPCHKVIQLFMFFSFRSIDLDTKSLEALELESRPSCNNDAILHDLSNTLCSSIFKREKVSYSTLGRAG
jgi:hypothetical protein